MVTRRHYGFAGIAGTGYYARLRPKLAIAPASVLNLNDRLGLHPALRPLMPAWDAGELAWIQGVGYPSRPIAPIFAPSTSGRPARPATRCWSKAGSPANCRSAPPATCRTWSCSAATTDPRAAATCGSSPWSRPSASSATPGVFGRSTHDSEFGRRPAENASGGTDHGTAAPHLVLGGQVKGGLYGEMPDLNALEQSDLRHTVDYRRLYATVTERWWTRTMANADANGPPMDWL